ncbi:glutaredoxin [Candidatus Endobugula sertula]|uniref:Glutaredoxin n=1 Tax=Candidatus Endobugula sertula TaxID=62101 RepID=A0A1D2QQC1_9GAMM|nr:glutaredoxin [Candidatus Endobugula sertula]
MQSLILYSTLGCHLCELAKEQLTPLLEEFSLCLVEVDIADDEALLKKYGVRIPVIKCKKNEQELGWPFDTKTAYQFLVEGGGVGS